MPVFLVLLVVVLGAVGAVLGLAFRESVQLTHPGGYTHPKPAGFAFQATPRSAHGLDHDEVSFPTPSGETVRGWLVPAAAGSPVVLSVHGRGGDRTDFSEILPPLHAAGISVLSIDLRENGLSDGAGRGTGLAMREADDIDAAVAFLRQGGHDRITVIGCSLGASAALLAAARNEAIAAVVADSPLMSFRDYVGDGMRRRLGAAGRIVPDAAYGLWADLVLAVTRWRLSLPPLVDPLSVVERIPPRPVLLIHGTLDRAVPLHHSRRLADAAPGAAVWEVEGAGHCAAAARDPAAYARRVVDLATKAVPTPAP